MKLKGIERFAVIGAGFIGKSLIRNLLVKGCEINVLDRHGCPDEFIGKVTWFTGNFHDRSALDLALHGAAVAYHLVSTTVPGDQNIDVAKELNENVVGSLHLVTACLSAGVKRIVFASSSSVYGKQDYFPISELASTNPISAHGIHKLTVEKFLLLAKHFNGIDVRVFRMANPYGPDQSILGRQGFVAIAIGNILRGIPLPLSDKGRLVRDFIYIEDLAEALVLGGSLDGIPSIINIGSGTGYSLRDVVDVIAQLIGRQVETISTEPRIVDIPVSVLDIGLAQSAMSFSPTTSLRHGIGKTLCAHGLQVGD
jgi:UDP-glucose 4-epimerase